MKRIIIIGASSGIGSELTRIFVREGCTVGIAARREEPLRHLSREFPSNVKYETIDVSAFDAPERLSHLISSIGGMDMFLYCAGCGWNNPELNPDFDRRTLATNVLGFTTMINTAYKYFISSQNYTRPLIAAITSIAGTKGIGISATYSASKRYESTYLQAIEQLARMQEIKLDICDIRPGFVNTAFLDTASHRYPMTMDVKYVADRIGKAIMKRKRVCIVDFRWKIVTVLWHLLPNRIWRRIKLT